MDGTTYERVETTKKAANDAYKELFPAPKAIKVIRCYTDDKVTFYREW